MDTPVDSNQMQAYGALIGVDWADQKHCFTLCANPAGNSERGVFSQDPQQLHEWVQSLQARFGERRIAIVIEQSKGPLINALAMHADFVDIFCVHPTTAGRYRKVFHSSGAKTDFIDSDSLLDLLRKHPEKLRIHQNSNDTCEKLEILCQSRRRAVNRRTSLLNQLTGLLKSYYPQALKMIDPRDKTSPMSIEFLRRWPSWSKLKATRKTTLRSFYWKHNSRSERAWEKRLMVLNTQHALSENATLLETSQMELQALLGEIRAINKSIESFENAIRHAFRQTPNREVFQSLPGCAENLAPRMAAAMGANPQRWKSALNLQTYSGIAPIQVLSNERGGTFARGFCPKFMRQTFHEHAGCSVQKSAWAKAFYTLRRERNQRPQAIKRALAFKWQRIIYRCSEQGVVYDENKYIERLKRRNSPLIPKMREMGLLKH